MAMARRRGRRWGAATAPLLIVAAAAAAAAAAAWAHAAAAEPIPSISSFPGCGGGGGGSLKGALGAGLFDCHVHEQGLPAGERRLYALTLPPPSSSSGSAPPAASTSPSSSPRPFSTLVYLRTRNGEAEMSLHRPTSEGGGGGLGLAAPDEHAAPTLDAGAAAGESFLALGPDAPAGTYIVAVRAVRGSPSLDLEVVTTPSGVRLAEADRRALAAVVDECCAGGGTARDDELEATLPFCSVVAPIALSSYSSLGRGEASGPVQAEWRSDLCHTAPNACDAQGRITRLGLRNAGLRCPGGFPRAFGELAALRHADLSGNDFGGQPFNEVERALAASESLTSLLVADSNLAGAIGCGAAQMGRLRVLDARDNRLDGAVPACLLSGGGGGTAGDGGRGGKGRLAELYLGGNALGGPLPALGAGGNGSLVALSLDNQRGTGLQKAALPRGGAAAAAAAAAARDGGPAALLAKNPALRFLDIGGNPDVGPWRLPSDAPVALASLAYLNVSSTGLVGAAPERLPEPLWLLDASNNGLTGPLPAALARQPALVSLRLGGNRLDGTLQAFADALPPTNRILELNVSGNARLHGPVPDFLASLALFDVSAAAGAPAAQPRALALDGTSLSGPFPSWLVTRVPPVRAACACPVAVAVGGPDSRLQCPDEGSARVSDLEWQVASDLSYECWRGRGQGHIPLVDVLTSPSEEEALAARDRGEAWTIGDGGLPAEPSRRAGAIAGIVIGCVLGVVLLAGGAAAWLLRGRRWFQARRAREAQMASMWSAAKLKSSCGGQAVAGGVVGTTSGGGGGGGGAPGGGETMLPSMLSTATSVVGLLEHPSANQI